MKNKQDLINALQITLVDAIQKRDMVKALQVSKLLKHVLKGMK